MKMIHVVPQVEREASGPSYSVPRLCQALASCGHDVELSCLAAGAEIDGVRLDVHREWPVLGRFALSPGHAMALSKKARHVDIVHNHSLWSMVNVAAGLVVPGKRAKLVVSPRGTLSPWALQRSRRIKALVKPLQWRALQRADLLHATSEIELQEIRALGLRAPVVVIPNGIDVPPECTRLATNGTRTLLFLSRIHPKKGIDRLLLAWQRLEKLHPGWQLVIAGEGDAEHVKKVQFLATHLHLKRIIFTGPLFGKEKAAAYRGADLFVLPTHSENFGMVVAEALAHGCPVIVGRGAPWADVETVRCGWWVDNAVDSLVFAIAKAIHLSDCERAAMGRRGRDWMLREFSWSAIGLAMSRSYEWLHGGKSISEISYVN